MPAVFEQLSVGDTGLSPLAITGPTEGIVSRRALSSLALLCVLSRPAISALTVSIYRPRIISYARSSELPGNDDLALGIDAVDLEYFLCKVELGAPSDLAWTSLSGGSSLLNLRHLDAS